MAEFDTKKCKTGYKTIAYLVFEHANLGTYIVCEGAWGGKNTVYLMKMTKSVVCNIQNTAE